MDITKRFLASLALLPLLAMLSIGAASSQAGIGKAILEKLTAKVAKLESTCARDIKKFCHAVTPGEGRVIHCLQAYDDKISTKCAFELGEAATSAQTTADALKDGVIACKAEIAGVCGTCLQGRDSRRVRQDGARAGPDRRMPAREQSNGFGRLRGSDQEA